MPIIGLYFANNNFCTSLTKGIAS